MVSKQKVTEVIGKTYADRLDEPVFVVNTWQFSRRDMVEELGCANFIAAVRLAKVLRRLNISGPAQLFRLDPASLARTHGIGEACIFVAMCILESDKFDVMKWWKCDGKFRTEKHRVIRKAAKHKQVA